MHPVDPVGIAGRLDPFMANAYGCNIGRNFVATFIYQIRRVLRNHCTFVSRTTHCAIPSFTSGCASDPPILSLQCLPNHHSFPSLTIAALGVDVKLLATAA